MDVRLFSSLWNATQERPIDIPDGVINGFYHELEAAYREAFSHDRRD